MKLKKGIMFSLAVLLCVGIMSFMVPQDHKKAAPWKIPAKYSKMKNEYKADKSLNKVGKSLYNKHCKSCHGSKGLGNGSKAKQLETFPGDFSSAEFQAGSEGDLYYKSFVGRDEMPNFEKKMPDDEDRWAVINFIRTLKK